jgi:hypothetical protein
MRLYRIVKHVCVWKDAPKTVAATRHYMKFPRDEVDIPGCTHTHASCCYWRGVRARSPWQLTFRNVGAKGGATQAMIGEGLCKVL